MVFKSETVVYGVARSAGSWARRDGRYRVKKAVCCGVSAMALLIGMAAAAHAQQSLDAIDAPGSGEIIVTATRRETKLSETPVSIAVIGADYLERTGTSNFRDLGFAIPNFSLNENSNSPILSDISIRGIAGAGRVGYYVDEVLVGTSAGFNQDLVDIDRVEFLRGPQAVAFGRNTLAGAISIVTKAPSLTDYSGTAAFKYGSYNTIQGEASITGPIVADRIGFRVSGIYRKRDGFDVIRSGGRGNDEDSWALRGALLIKPAEGFEVTLRYMHGQDRAQAFYLDAYDDLPASPDPGNCSNAGLSAGLEAGLDPVSALFGNCSAAGFPAGTFARADGNPFDRKLDAGPQRNHSNRDTDIASGKLVFERAGIRFTSITAYTDIRYDLQRDLDYSRSTLDTGPFPTSSDLSAKSSGSARRVKVGLLGWLVDITTARKTIRRVWRCSGRIFACDATPSTGCCSPVFQAPTVSSFRCNLAGKPSARSPTRSACPIRFAKPIFIATNAAGPRASPHMAPRATR